MFFLGVSEIDAADLACDRAGPTFFFFSSRQSDLYSVAHEHVAKTRKTREATTILRKRCRRFIVVAARVKVFRAGTSVSQVHFFFFGWLCTLILYFRLVAKPLASLFFGHLCARMNLERLKPSLLGANQDPRKGQVASCPNLICQDLILIQSRYNLPEPPLCPWSPRRGLLRPFCASARFPSFPSRIDSSFQWSGHRSNDTFTKKVGRGERGALR